MSDKTPTDKSPQEAVQEPAEELSTGVVTSDLDNESAFNEKEKERHSSAEYDVDPVDDIHETTKPLPKAPLKARRMPWLGLFFVLLLLALTALGWWFGRPLYQQWQMQQQAVFDLQDQVELLKVEQRNFAQKSQLETSLSQTAQSLRTNLDEVRQQMQDNLVQLGTALAEKDGIQQADMLGYEADYLLRLANDRLVLEHDWRGAEQILARADVLLARSGEVRFLQVRELIANERRALQSLQPLDTTELFFGLKAMRQQAEQWSWWPGPSEQVEAEQLIEEQSWTWRGLWDQLLTVRYRDEAESQAPIAPETFIAKQLLLDAQFAQAQSATLMRDQAMWTALVESLSTTLATYFAQEQETASMIAQLTTWQTTPLAAELPDISGSSMALSRLLFQGE